MMYRLLSLKGEAVDVLGRIVTPKMNCTPVSNMLTITSGVLTTVVVVAVESVKSGV